MFTLRYLPGVDLRDRKHTPCVPQYTTWVAADDARLALPPEIGDRLEVVER